MRSTRLMRMILATALVVAGLSATAAPTRVASPVDAIICTANSMEPECHGPV